MPDEKLTAYRGGKALRRGWTTGSCAAAASQAAAVLLLTGIAPPEIHLHTPGGITFCLPVEDAHMSGNAAVCTVRKDAGDDPDITNGDPHFIGCPCAESKSGVTIEGGSRRRTSDPPGTGGCRSAKRRSIPVRVQQIKADARAPCRTAERLSWRLFCHHFGGGRRSACAHRPTTVISALSAASLSSARAALSSR